MKENQFQKYVDNGLIYRCEGCDEEELNAIASHFKLKLPNSYIDFLKIAGREFISHDQFRFGWDGIKNVKKSVQHYIKLTGKTIEIKESDFFFWQDEFSFGFFNLEEGDNPPVYWFNVSQEENEFCQVAESFTDFVEFLIQEEKPNQKWFTKNLVLYKEILRDKKEISPFDKTNLKYTEQIFIPENIFNRIDTEYKGTERRVSRNLISDLIKEKAKFIIDNEKILAKILNLAEGNFDKLSFIYYDCVIRNLEKDFKLISSLNKKEN